MENLKDIASYILVAFGITFSPTVYFAGLFLALGMALLVREYSPTLRKTSRILNAITVILLSTVAAIGATKFFPEVPVQLVMAAIGPFAVPLVKRFANRSDELADKVLDKVTGDSNNVQPEIYSPSRGEGPFD